jgi:hypothetical protein
MFLKRKQVYLKSPVEASSASDFFRMNLLGGRSFVS